MPESIPSPSCGLCEHYRAKRDDGAPEVIKSYGWCRKKRQETSANQKSRGSDCFELRKPHGWETPQVATVDVKSWVKVVTCDDCPALRTNGLGEVGVALCKLADRGWNFVRREESAPPPYWCPLRVGPAAIMLKEAS